MTQELLSYDDVILKPQYSGLRSRSEADTSCEVWKYKRKTPIISANMETVSGSEMAVAMWKAGGVGALHRFQSLKQNVSEYKNVTSMLCDGVACDCFVSVGVNGESRERAAALYEAGASMFIIDIAHGHSVVMRDMINWMRMQWGKNIFIVAGNVATAEAVKDLEYWGADCIKVGIGPGAICTTRMVTGHGVPQFSALIDCSRVAKVPLIADGGIKNSGDAAKALVYADYVMLGSMLAGTDESPGKVINGRKKHMGSSSYERAGIAKEGVQTTVPLKGSVVTLIDNMTAGLRSALSYSGAFNLKEFSLKAKWQRQTTHSYLEGTPHVQRGNK